MTLNFTPVLLHVEEIRKRTFLSGPLPRFFPKSKAGKGVLSLALSLPRYVTLGKPPCLWPSSLLFKKGEYNTKLSWLNKVLQKLFVTYKELHKCKFLLLLHSKREVLKLRIRSIPTLKLHCLDKIFWMVHFLKAESIAKGLKNGFKRKYEKLTQTSLII